MASRAGGALLPAVQHRARFHLLRRADAARRAGPEGRADAGPGRKAALADPDLACDGCPGDRAYQMAAVAQRLQGAGVPMREFPQTTGNLTEIGSNLYELIEARGLVAYSDPDIRLAISRAVAVETPRG